MNQAPAEIQEFHSEIDQYRSTGHRLARRRLGGIALIGLGYWGPNWLRNLQQLGCAERTIACDVDAKCRERIRTLYPGIELSSSLDQLLDDPGIEALIVATPVGTHYTIARKALEAGKAVLVEKPLATSIREAEELVRLARQSEQVLMVGHTFEYSAPVLKLKELISSGELGEIFYISSVRANLGLFQHDVNVAWDLATHDISIILLLMGRAPEAVSCHGKGHYRHDVEDVALLTLHFAGDVIAFIHVSWLDPNKIRRTTVVGSRKMVVYDDTAAQEKIRIYDKGVAVASYYDTYSESRFAYRSGDTWVPRIEEAEPLRSECEHFADCVRRGTRPRTDGLCGLRVVSVLEAANDSLRNGGAMTPVKCPVMV
jgi:predicted dehydrogenase